MDSIVQIKEVPNFAGIDQNLIKTAHEAYRSAKRSEAAIKLQKEREESKMSTGYSPVLNERTQVVQVTYTDGTSETFEVHNCNTESSPFYKVLNYHRSTLKVQKPIQSITNKVDKPVFKQIY